MIYHNNKFRYSLPIIAILLCSWFILLSGFYNETWIFDWKDSRKEIIDSIHKSQYYYHQFGFGESGYSNESKSLKWLSRNAEIHELESMIEYPIGNIRLVGYLGLLHKEDFDKLDMLKLALKDTTIVNIRYGCIIQDVKINNHIAKTELSIDSTIPPAPNMPNGESYENYIRRKYGLSQEDKTELQRIYYSYNN